MSGEQAAEQDQIAEWLGDMPEAYNVTDYTDEQTTVITIDVDTLARRLADRIAARQIEAVRSARAEIAAMLDRFPQQGRHTRARWAEEWLGHIVERRVGEWRPLCSCAPDCAERIACPEIGTLGHMGCGWCDEHGQARHICLCQPSEMSLSPERVTPR